MEVLYSIKEHRLLTKKDGAFLCLGMKVLSMAAFIIEEKAIAWREEEGSMARQA